MDDNIDDMPISLHKLAREGNAEELKSVFATAGKKGFRPVPPVDDREDGCTALDIAAIYGHAEAVNVLLQKGKADINAQNESGLTALHRAAMWNQTDVVTALLYSDAELDLYTTTSGNRGEETAVQTAQRYGHEGMVTHIENTLLEKKQKELEEENNKDKKKKKKK